MPSKKVLLLLGSAVLVALAIGAWYVTRSSEDRPRGLNHHGSAESSASALPDHDTPLACETPKSDKYTALVRGVHHAKAPIVWVRFESSAPPPAREAERALRACAEVFLKAYDITQTAEELALVAWHQPAGSGPADATVIQLPDGSIGFSYDPIAKRLLTSNERGRGQSPQ